MRRLIGTLLLLGILNARICEAATVLVTGADRGPGLEFVRQYAARGDTVIAACRTPGAATEHSARARARAGILVENLDVDDDEDIKAMAAKCHGKPIDILIKKAGITDATADTTLGSFSRPGFNHVMDTNVYGALALSQALLSSISQSHQKKIIAVTSGAGAIRALPRVPMIPLYYSISKAPLHLAMRALGVELAPQGIVVGPVGPGRVDTDINASAHADYRFAFKPITKAQSIHGLIAATDGRDQAKGGAGRQQLRRQHRCLVRTLRA